MSSIRANPLNDAEKVRVREWLRERRCQDGCPMIVKTVLDDCRDPG